MTSERKDDDAAHAALEYIKQIIALASGILALSGTFIEKLVKIIGWHTVALPVAWILLLTSIYCGLATISTIVKSKLNGNQDWAEGTGKRYAQACKISFVGGIGLFLIFVLSTLFLQAEKGTADNAAPLKQISHSETRGRGQSQVMTQSY
jgi:hypothetical protein